MKALALDTETNAKDPRYDPDFRLLGVSYASNSLLSADYLPIGHYGQGEEARDGALRQLRCHLVVHDTIVFHNAKFDLLTIKRGLGIDLYEENWFDTMLMQHMVDENLPSKSLDFLGKHHFNEGKEKDKDFEAFVKGPGWGFIPIWMMRPYAIQDAKLTLALFEKLYPAFVQQGFGRLPKD